MLAEKFQEMSLKVFLDRSMFSSEFVSLGERAESHTTSSTFYLLLPIKILNFGDSMIVDWDTVRRCLASPVFGNSADPFQGLHSTSDTLKLRNGTFTTRDIMNSLVFTPHSKKYFFIHDINHEKNVYSLKSEKHSTYEAYYKKRQVFVLQRLLV